MTDDPTYSGRVSLQKLLSWNTFKGMHPTMQATRADEDEFDPDDMGILAVFDGMPIE